LALPDRGIAPRLEDSFSGLGKGLIEFEVLAEPDGGVSDAGFELSLLDSAGRVAAVLATDPERRFYTRLPSGVTPLEPPVTYTGINPKPPLRFVQGRF
jgi:hypothetical protein